MTMSTGTGGTIGGPPTPLPMEQEATAATVHKQIASGIIPPELYDIIPFTQMNPPTTWKYSSDASKPVIPTLRRLPVGAKPIPEKDTSWIQEFERLLNLLPKDVRERFAHEAKQPLADRNAAYADLDTFLGFMSDFKAWMDRVTRPMDFESVARTHIVLNQMLPDQVRQETLFLAKAILEASREHLRSVGPNDPNFDLVLAFTNKFGASIAELESGNSEVVSKIAQDLAEWKTQLQGRSLGDEWQVLRTAIELMSFTATTSALTSGSRALLFSLAIATIGIEQTSKQAGILSPALNEIRQLIAAALLPQDAVGGHFYLSMLLTMGTIAALTGGILAASHLSSMLLLELCLTCFVSSNLVSMLSAGLVNSAGANTEVAQSILSTVFLLMFLVGTAQTNEEKALTLIAGVKPHLISWLSTIEPFINQYDVESRLNVLTSEAKRALEEDHLKQFLENAREITEILKDQDFNNTISQLKNLSNTIWNNAIIKDEYNSTKANINVLQG